MSAPNSDGVEAANDVVVKRLRPRTGADPLPPPPPLAWYYRRPARWGARGLTAAVCLWAVGVWYTNRTCDISGQVLDMDGQPVSGVLVRTEGSPTGTVSDPNGTFLLVCRGTGTARVVMELPGSGGTALPVELAQGRRVELGRMYLYSPQP